MAVIAMSETRHAARIDSARLAPPIADSLTDTQHAAEDDRE
jgi:hypothetical protein